MPLGRYCYTREAAAALRIRDLGIAWRVLRDAGLEPIGKERDGHGSLCIWRGAEVAGLVRRRGGRSSAELRRETQIRQGIARRRQRQQRNGQ